MQQPLPADRRKAPSSVRNVILDNLDPSDEEGMQYRMIGYVCYMMSWIRGSHPCHKACRVAPVSLGENRKEIEHG